MMFNVNIINIFRQLTVDYVVYDKNVVHICSRQPRQTISVDYRDVSLCKHVHYHKYTFSIFVVYSIKLYIFFKLRETKKILFICIFLVLYNVEFVALHFL